MLFKCELTILNTPGQVLSLPLGLLIPLSLSRFPELSLFEQKTVESSSNLLGLHIKEREGVWNCGLKELLVYGRSFFPSSLPS